MKEAEQTQAPSHTYEDVSPITDTRPFDNGIMNSPDSHEYAYVVHDVNVIASVRNPAKDTMYINVEKDLNGYEKPVVSSSDEEYARHMPHYQNTSKVHIESTSVAGISFSKNDLYERKS